MRESSSRNKSRERESWLSLLVVSSRELSWIFMATQKKRDWINELLFISWCSLFVPPSSVPYAFFLLSPSFPKVIDKAHNNDRSTSFIHNTNYCRDAVPCYCNLFLPFLVYHHTKPFILLILSPLRHSSFSTSPLTSLPELEPQNDGNLPSVLSSPRKKEKWKEGIDVRRAPYVCSL